MCSRLIRGLDWQTSASTMMTANNNNSNSNISSSAVLTKSRSKSKNNSRTHNNSSNISHTHSMDENDDVDENTTYGNNGRQEGGCRRNSMPVRSLMHKGHDLHRGSTARAERGRSVTSTTSSTCRNAQNCFAPSMNSSSSRCGGNVQSNGEGQCCCCSISKNGRRLSSQAPAGVGVFPASSITPAIRAKNAQIFMPTWPSKAAGNPAARAAAGSQSAVNWMPRGATGPLTALSLRDICQKRRHVGERVSGSSINCSTYNGEQYNDSLRSSPLPTGILRSRNISKRIQIVLIGGGVMQQSTLTM